MNLHDLHVTGFGKWRNRTFTFTPGLNVCAAPNESGKTTLLQAIIASLYGMKRDYVRVTRYLDEYEQYLPWDHGSYETIVRYTLQNQNFRLHRNFAKDKEFAKLYQEPDLVELNTLYQEDRRKEFNFVEKHLGMTRTIFTDVTWVRSQPLAASDRLVSTLSVDHKQDPIMRKLTGGLDTELTLIGKKENAENTLFGKANKQLAVAKQSLADAEQAWQSVQHLTLEVAQWQSQIESALLQKRQWQAKREQLELHRQHLQEWWQFSYKTKETNDMLQWINQAQTEVERSFHQRVWEQLHEMDEIAQRYLAVKSNHETKEKQTTQENPSFFLRFAEMEEEEWQSWQKSWYAYQTYEGKHGEENGNKRVSVPSSIDLDKLQADYRQGLDLRRQIEEQRKVHSKLVMVATKAEPSPGRTARAQGRGVKQRRNQGRLWAFNAVLMVMALGLEIVNWNSQWFAGFTLPLHVLAGILVFIVLGLSTKAVLLGRQQSQHAQPNQPIPLETSSDGAADSAIRSQLEAVEQQIQALESKLIAIAKGWGTPSWEEFLAFREEHLMLIHQMQVGKQAEKEQARLKLKMEQTMLQWGVPHHLSFEEAAKLVLQERGEWERRLKDEQDKLESELADERLRLKVTEEYEQATKQRKAILTRWEEQVREKLQKEQKQLEQEFNEIASKLDQSEALIAKRREDIAHATGEIGQRDQVSWAKAKSIYDEALEQVNQLQQRRDALTMAQDLLNQAWKEWHRELSPDLNEASSEIMGQITNGKYTDVRLDPLQKYTIRVIEPSTREVIGQQQLSSGTQDQLYLAQRFALLRHISREKEPLPIFLDDHFIHYDDERLAETLQYVAKLAEEHQVFLFSCQSREQQLLASIVSGNERHQVIVLDA
ncbi:ATP-binding protein [Brevibacillus ginsengisoli]|uniref:ATP-binding protein n=1 Tax=Brevibacillus ginsengisoli TaxID=363854 RepID=UPI003CE91BA5